MPRRPFPPAALLVLPLLGVLLAGCGGEATPPEPPESGAGASSSPTAGVLSPDAVPSTPGAAPTTTAAAPPAFDGTEIVVTYAGGTVSPPAGKREVRLGSKVRLTVTSDVAEEVHVHTYDLTAALSPGQPGVIEFTASIPGQHEVELEGSHDALLELVVR